MTQTARQAVVAPSNLPSFICDPNPRAIDLAGNGEAKFAGLFSARGAYSHVDHVARDNVHGLVTAYAPFAYNSMRLLASRLFKNSH